MQKISRTEASQAGNRQTDFKTKGEQCDDREYSTTVMYTCCEQDAEEE